MFERSDSIIGKPIEDKADCDKTNDNPSILGLLIVSIGIEGLFLLILRRVIDYFGNLHLDLHHYSG